MGDIIKGKCECGFETKKLFYGAGMMDEGICNVPSIKKNSDKIEMKNIWRREHFPEYVFYTDSVMFDNSVESTTIDSWENQLKTHGNFCPNCREYKMEFQFLGMFD